MNLCRCGAKTDLSGGLCEPPDPDTQSQWWQRCGRCGLPSHAVQDRVYSVRCPRSTVAPLACIGKANGQFINRWALPDQQRVETIEYVTYPRRVRVNSTEPLVFSVWNLLMQKVATIMADPGPASDEVVELVQRAKHQARGIAETLYILMDPFMESADAVVKHAVAKFKDPDYDVPGLGEHLWDPHMNPDGTPRIPVAQPKSKPVARPKPRVDNSSTKKLSDDEAAGIKEAVSSGMFTKEEVAAMFKVSLATVEAAVA